MMSFEDAERLAQHIEHDMPAWKPQSKQIGNGEWVVWLYGKRDAIVWSIDDWNNNFVPRSQPAKQEEQEVSM